MSLLAVAAAASALCGPISFQEATTLALQTPEVRASAEALGTHPAVALHQALADRWLLRVYAADGCEGADGACSSLIAYYLVEKRTAVIRDLARDGEVVTGEALRAAQTGLNNRCRG